MSYADTAGAAAFVSPSRAIPQACAIAPRGWQPSSMASNRRGQCRGRADNMTRFVVLAREPLDPASLKARTTMTTFVFEVKNIPAALYKALGGLPPTGST
jgi:prephenate dehydratase